MKRGCQLEKVNYLKLSPTMKWAYFDLNFSSKKYFTVAVSCSELKPIQTFTVMHEKFIP